MGIIRELRAQARMLANRVLVRSLVTIDDPVARVLARRSLPDPYPMYERIRARGEISRHLTGLRLTASYELCRTVLRDARFEVLSARDLGGADWNIYPGDEENLVHPTEHSILTMNPPDHSRLRRLASPSFAPKAVREFAPRIKQVVTDLVSGISERSEFDLVRDFAALVPIEVICELFDLPRRDHARMARWGNTMLGTLDGIRTAAERRAVRQTLAEMTELFTELIRQRRRNPGSDVVSTLATADVDGQPCEVHELVGLVGLLLIGGFETTAHAISGAGLALLRDRKIRDWMLDVPDRAADIVEETLRKEPPIPMTIRRAKVPVVLGGTELPAGTILVLLIAGANRDPRVFPDPRRFDPTRPNSRDHLAFSGGAHYCVGSGLARLEAEIALSTLFRLLPEAALAGPVRYKTTRNIRGIATLPVRPAH
jgi:cytochrome P450